ncbi:PilZ domain-containing protein [bacterium]|nr:PilZ domain-containing protein [bacterium]
MPNPKIPIERSRHDVRFSISIPIEYEKVYNPAREKTIKKTTARDLSGGGIQFETDEDIPKGIKLSLRIKMPNLGKFFTVNAEVTHSKKISSDVYDIGAKFLNISQEAKEAMNMFYYINRLERKGPIATYQK